MISPFHSDALYVALRKYAPQIRWKVAVHHSAPCLIFEMSRVQNWAQGPAIKSEVLVSFRHALRNECVGDTPHRVAPCPFRDLPICCSLIILGTGLHLVSRLRIRGVMPLLPPVHVHGSDRDCWLEVCIRKVLRPVTSTQGFLGFPVSISKC